MLGKMTLLAVAVCSMAAIAIPTAASADWQKDLQDDVTIGLTGNWRIVGGLGGIECQITSTWTIQPGTTGTAESWTPHPTSDTTNCRGLGGWAFCQVHDFTPKGLPWTLHTASATTVSIEFSGITNTTTGAFCPIKHLTTTPATLTATPNQPDTFSSFTISGSTQVDPQTNNGSGDPETGTISGVLQVEAEGQRGVFSI
jgi:hypothetical protein